MNILNVPNLRFPNYKNSWSNLRIKNILSICHGKDYKHLNHGDIPVLGSGGVITFVDKYLCNWECVLIGRKGTIDKPQYMSQPFWSVDTLFYSKPKPNHSPKFQYYLFKTINWGKHNEGSGVPSLSASTIESLKILVPDIEEQIKIANFMSKIDERINTQSKIIEDLRFLKKVLMEHILNSFDFEELSLKDFIEQSYARIIKSSELKPFIGTKQYLSTSSIGEDGIEQIEQTITYDNRPSRASMLPIKNSIWFAKMKNSIKVYQSIGEDEHIYVLSTGFYGILCNDMKVNPTWIFEIFKSDYFNNQKDRFSEGSSMSGIKDNQLSDIRIKLFLNKNEEKSCSELLGFLSKKIEVERKLLEKYKEQKKFLLSNMFI